MAVRSKGRGMLNEDKQKTCFRIFCEKQKEKDAMDIFKIYQKDETLQSYSERLNNALSCHCWLVARARIRDIIARMAELGYDKAEVYALMRRLYDGTRLIQNITD